MRRAFVDDDRLLSISDGGELTLPERLAHRFARVLRLADGTPVEVFDKDGRAVRGQFQNPDRVSACSCSFVDEGLPPLIVVQALTKTDKLELVAQKATELGCTRLLLWKSARSQIKLDDERGEKKQKRLQRIADDAARQSGRARPPAIEGPLATTEVVEVLKAVVAAGGVAVTGMVDADVTLSAHLAAHSPRAGFCIVIGPEGGVSAEEEDAFSSFSVGVRLSRFVLRTETAALVALSVVQTALGEA